MICILKKLARAMPWLIGHGGLARVPLLSLALIGVFLSEGAAAQEVIRVGGTGTGTLLIQHISKAYSKLKPGVQVIPVLPPMGSNGSLRALASGAIQIAIVTFPSIYPAPEKPGDAVENDVISWVRTPFVFTGRDIVSGTKLTQARVADIYSGRLAQWQNGRQIRLITRTERESDTRILRATSPVMDQAVLASVGRVGMSFAENDLDNQKLLESTAGSFGGIGLGQVLLEGSPLKPVSLDGILPSASSLESGAYRIEKPLHLVTSKAASPATLEFIRYLQSPDIVKKLRRFGFIPMQHD